MTIKPHQIREMKPEDIKQSLADSHEALQNYLFQHGTGQLENYKAISNTKKDIARYKTILKELDLGISKTKSTKK
jgi:large subunit ribosomal protein L29